MNKHLTLPLTAFSIAILSFSSLTIAEDNVKSSEAKTTTPTVEATTPTAKSDEKQMDMKEVMKIMTHVSPMPSLMMVVSKNEDTLKLTDEQKANFKKFREEHGAKGKELAKEIIKEEKAIREAVLAGEPTDKIMEMLKGTMQIREKISTSKVMCRYNLKKTLDENQWKKVIEAYKASTSS